MRNLILALLFSTLAQFAHAVTYGVIYIHDGKSAIDVPSIKAFTTMVARLNRGAVGTGIKYDLVEVNTFQQAYDVNSNPQSKQIDYTAATCVHGLFNTDHSYTGNVIDTETWDDGTPKTISEAEFRSKALSPENCGETGNVDINN